MTSYVDAPERCDVCQSAINSTFYDMRTKHGPWANMCPPCALHGIGIAKLGTGFGQKYELQQDGSYIKTEG